jgi:hypothetical protein
LAETPTISLGDSEILRNREWGSFLPLSGGGHLQAAFGFCYNRSGKAMGYNTNDPIKRACYREYQRALRAGTLVRRPCQVCGDPKSDGHHKDHTKPLEVEWLCRSHHMMANTKARTFELCSKGGKTSGRMHVESGQIKEIHALGGKAWGPIQGQRNVESGLLARIQSIGGKTAMHNRWHRDRGCKSLNCELCYP